MPVDSRAVSVGSTATRLDTIEESAKGSQQVLAVHNNGTATVYIGDEAVTTANGFPLSAGASMSIEVDSSADAIFGVAASGTIEVRVLEVGV